MNWSPRFVASLSVTLSRLSRSRETSISPPCPSTFGSRSMAFFTACFSFGTATPARDSSDDVPPSSWSSSVDSRCCGSIAPLSLPSARLCASASACWNLVVSLSKRMVSPRGYLTTFEMGSCPADSSARAIHWRGPACPAGPRPAPAGSDLPAPRPSTRGPRERNNGGAMRPSPELTPFPTAESRSPNRGVARG